MRSLLIAAARRVALPRVAAATALPVLALTAGLCPAPALGQTPADWPAAGRNIRLIVPSPGGSGTGDTIARIMAEEVGRRLPANFVVDNKPGANGNIGATAAAQAPGDGYNFLFSWAGTLAVNQAMYKQMGYDSQRDFVPIVLIADVPNILVVNNDLPVKTLEDFTRHVKAHPGKLSYGSTGIGSSMHLAGELYSREAGAQMVHVPFSNPGNAVTNLISGEIQLMFQLIPGVAGQVKAGRVRAVGVMADKRSPALPDVPTMVELGAPRLMSSTWFALLAPKGTPAAALERMNAATNEALADPAVRKRLTDIGATPLGGTAKQLADHLAAEIDKWGRVVREAKIQVQ
ncbi:MAG: tripartite tricarboxylate transporter substrate binding protein [Rubrivivax sp.]|nr:tripartite tricarboxylate transporter substrate binding protein [Rubrivivax sp.]